MPPPFADSLRTAVAFLSKPAELWASGRFDVRKAVLKLVFTQRLPYDRNSGLRTAGIALPFLVLTPPLGDDLKFAEKEG